MQRSTAAAPRKRALVLDDEANAAAIVCQMLRSSGFDAQAFTAPMPFLVEVREHAPDVVLIDLALGDSDAVDVMRQLEVVKFKGNILLISGRDKTTLQEIRSLGLRHNLAMLPSLRKPFRQDDLDRTLKSVPETQGKLDSGQAAVKHADPEVHIDLQKALQERWLELWYQPKIDLKSLLICGAEGLLRARHPALGIIAPAQMLPTAGDPLYQPLSRLVIRQAIADWQYFAEAGLSLKLAVNVPASVIQAPDFITIVRDMLPKHDRRFPGLIVEITEDDVIRDPQQVQELATQLKLYNVSLSIDDFGRAYSSLSRMFDFACAEVKIDRCFVSGCASDERKRAVCKSIIEVAHRFGSSVCGEGVEAIEDLRCRVELGCDTAQGFFFAKPMERELFLARAGKKAAPAGRTAAARQ